MRRRRSGEYPLQDVENTKGKSTRFTGAMVNTRKVEYFLLSRFNGSLDRFEQEWKDFKAGFSTIFRIVETYLCSCDACVPNSDRDTTFVHGLRMIARGSPRVKHESRIDRYHPIHWESPRLCFVRLTPPSEHSTMCFLYVSIIIQPLVRLVLSSAPYPAEFVSHLNTCLSRHHVKARKNSIAGSLFQHNSIVSSRVIHSMKAKLCWRKSTFSWMRWTKLSSQCLYFLVHP